MAVTAGTVWRIGPSGSNVNGGGFDPTVVSPGTDYSQQNAPQVSFTDLVVDATDTSKCTSAAHPFTSAHAGNLMNITGGDGFLLNQRVVILSVTGGVAACSAAVGFIGGTAGVANLGGRIAFTGAANSNPIFTQVLPGNTVYFLGVTGNAASYPTSSLDYNVTGIVAPPVGATSADGRIFWRADPSGPMPTIGGDGLLFYNLVYQTYSGLYFVATGNNYPTYGMLNAVSPTLFDGCVINTNGQAGLIGVTFTSNAVGGGEIANCTLRGSATAFPSLSAGAYLISAETPNVSIINNTLLNGLANGINESTGIGMSARFNRVSGCAGNGISTDNVDPKNASNIEYNTIDNNLGHGIAVTGVAGIAAVAIRNNAITNHTGIGKAGISVSNGSVALNNLRKRYCNYNDLYNNTSNYSNISAGANDLHVDPGYANTSTGDYTPTNAAMQAALP